MSTAFKAAIQARMRADSAAGGLTTLVAADPGTPTAPAIFNTFVNEAPPVYDCITWRTSDGTPDGRFRAPVPGATAGIQQKEEITVDFELWTQSGTYANLEAIRERLDALFHQQGFPTADPNVAVFYAERIGGEHDSYDPKPRAWFKLLRYLFRLNVQR